MIDNNNTSSLVLEEIILYSSIHMNTSTEYYITHLVIGLGLGAV